MITSVHSVAVVVSKLGEAKKWYTEKLGLSVLEDKGHWVTVGGQTGGAIHLCEGPALEPGNTGILMLCDNIDATYRELSNKGVDFVKQPQDIGFGKFAVFKDPDGNEFMLAQA